jgi:hypothetical protein
MFGLCLIYMVVVKKELCGGTKRDLRVCVFV